MVDQNLTYLIQVKEDLIYNINLHKSGKVITVIDGYKRSVDELQIVRDEIIKYQNHRLVLERKLEKKLKAYDYYLQEFEQAYEDLNSEPVILLFRKRKNEQKEE